MVRSNLLCASYIRYSSHKQSVGLSIETQKRKNENAVNFHNAIFVDHYIDEAVSGFHKNIGIRTGMKRLIKDITLGKVNCVVFIDESRLTRQIIDFYHDFYFPIHAVNPDLLFIKSHDNSFWDPHNTYAKYNLIDAYKESEKKRAYAINSQQLQLQNKIRPGSRLPLGVDSIQKSVITPNKDIAIVIFIFELASWGYTERKIAEILTSMNIGVMSPVSEETLDNSNFVQKKWCHTTIRSILYNPIYIGKCTWNRRQSRNSSTPKPLEQLSIFDEGNPVIPVQLWNLVHAKVLDLEQHSKHNSRIDTPYLVAGIVECSICSEKLLTKNSLKANTSHKKYTKKGLPLDYYYCNHCNYRIEHDLLDEHIIATLKKQLTPHFSGLKITKKINVWKRELDEDITQLQDDLHKQRFFLQSEQWNSLKLTADEKNRYLQLLENEIDDTDNQIKGQSDLFGKLNNLLSTNTIEQLIHRIVQSNLQQLNKIEQRYLLQTTIHRLSVKLLKNSEIIIDELCFNNLPLPFVK